MSNATSRPRKSSSKSAVAAEFPAGVRLTHPERIVYAEQGITKAELAAYYVLAAERMLPHVAGRPLSIVRCPAGRSGDCFYQKHPPVGMSASVERVTIREKSGVGEYLVVNDVAGLVTLVQFGALEIHVWGSRADDVEHADRVVFDLDPGPGVTWRRVIDAALMLRDVLKQLKLTSFVKTTGGKGLHVVVPIEPGPSWSEVKAFSRGLAETVAAERPTEFLSTMSKAARRGKIFIDYLRNERGATSVAPYSTRAREGAPVSMPVAWKTLPTVASAGAFRLPEVTELLRRRRADPWKDIDRVTQRLSPHWFGEK